MAHQRAQGRRKLSKSPRRIGALFISSIERNFCTRLFGFIVANQSVRVALLHPYDPSRERYLSSFDRVKLVFQLVNLVSDPVKQEIIAHGLPNSAAHDGDEQWQMLVINAIDQRVGKPAQTEAVNVWFDFSTDQRVGSYDLNRMMDLVQKCETSSSDCS
jgi:hypothetical protein